MFKFNIKNVEATLKKISLFFAMAVVLVHLVFSFLLNQTVGNAIFIVPVLVAVVVMALILLIANTTVTIWQLPRQGFTILLFVLIPFFIIYLIAFPGMHSMDTFFLLDHLRLNHQIVPTFSSLYALFTLGIVQIDQQIILLTIFQNLLFIYLVSQLLLNFKLSIVRAAFAVCGIYLLGMWYFVNVTSRDHLLGLLSAILFLKMVLFYKSDNLIKSLDLISLFMWLFFISELKPDATLLFINVIAYCSLLRKKIQNRIFLIGLTVLYVVVVIILNINWRNLGSLDPGRQSMLKLNSILPTLNVIAFNHSQKFSIEDQRIISKVVEFDQLVQNNFLQGFWGYKYENIKPEVVDRMADIVVSKAADHKMLVFKNMFHRYLNSLLIGKEPGGLRNDMTYILHQDSSILYNIKDVPANLLAFEIKPLKFFKDNFLRKYESVAAQQNIVNPFLAFFIFFTIMLFYTNNTKLIGYYVAFNLLREIVIFLLGPWPMSAYHTSLLCTFIVVLFYVEKEDQNGLKVAWS